MGKVTGFLEIEREDRDYQPVADRVKHWHEFVLPLPENEIRDQAARCMPVPLLNRHPQSMGAPDTISGVLMVYCFMPHLDPPP